MKEKKLDEFKSEDFRIHANDSSVRESISVIYENSALLGDISRRLPNIIKTLWKKTTSKELVTWAYEKTIESLIYQYDYSAVENAKRNETSSIIAFPLYVLNQGKAAFLFSKRNYAILVTLEKF